MEQAGREPSSGQVRTDDSSATAEEPKDCTALLEVQPEVLFAALVREMKEASETALVDAWKQSVAELFETVFKTVEVKPELVPVGKKRYPRLKGEEASHLLKFFEAVCVKGHGTYTDWVSHITAISRDLYNTNWTLTTILQSSLSKVRWSKAPVLNQWADKVKQGVNHHTTVEGPGAFPAFMFNPRKYTSSDIDRLKGICLQREAGRREHKLREGSEDEWAIIQGIAEGNIVSRRLPSFVKSILDAQERLRLCSTIQAQVEGELMFVLHGFTSISLNAPT
ncbi:hypothetical protein PR002_g24145 [Phytophthora rubi]|uniref:Uncharacterized protein n=1 Tax=Phytophthora rubi TaxID=129364 RepID=A0A6A3IBM5_9STRA|nr:hypothetical protein PR002_g24145 [Phytophthora rubi]